MSFMWSSPKRTAKVSSDSAAISFDLITNLTYMAVLATGDTPRDKIFEHVSRQRFKTAIYFQQVYLLAKRLGFEYSSSFQLVSERAAADSVKSVLLRFSGAISSGESESDFLAQEATVEREQYISRYERALETLQKWGDAYAALLVSVTLIVVVALISTMLMDIGNTFVIMLTATTFVITLLGAYIIYRSAPQEVKTYKQRKGPKERRRAILLLRTVTPVGAIAAVYLGYTSGIGLAFLVFGMSLIPAAIYAFKDDSKVSRIDQELANFIRALGNVSGALGTTLSKDMAAIDRRAMGAALEPYIDRLQARLRMYISPTICWDKFTDEIGSELVSRTSTMFVDGTGLGGSPERVGEMSSTYALSVALLRAKRHVTALPFAYLVILLHGAMTGLLIFVLEIMKSFNDRLATATDELASGGGGSGSVSIPDLRIFQVSDTGLMSHLVLGTVMMLTISNSLAPKFAIGGHALNTVVYGSIMCIVTGLNLVLIPPVSGALLTI